jgi:3'(2'), 5'-bisphosphate nucleotidase
MTMSRANRITDNYALLNNLHRLMWDASDAVIAVYRADDFGETLKSDQSPVTRADLAAHHVLVGGLKRLMPEIPVVSEEDAESVAIGRDASCYWLIDPLDGTKEFINRNDEFTCNLALVEDHQPTLGLVSVPALELLYYGGPSCDSKRINRDGEITSLKPARQPSLTRVVASKSHLNAETRAFIDGIEGEVELVQAGSSLKFLRVAEGLADIYPRLGPTCEWDTAAAHAVVLGVGGSVTDLDGAELRYGKDDILNPYFVVRAQTS